MALIEVENPQTAVELDFYMNGRLFENGIPVHLMIGGMGSVQSILDRTYLGLSGKRRLTQEDRAHFYIASHGVKHGSCESILGVVLTGVQTSFPIISALGPAGVWEYAKETYKFLKIAYESLGRGVQPTYSWNSDKSVVEVNTGTQTNIYNGPVYHIAQLSQPTYIELAKTIHKGDVSEFRLTQVGAREGVHLSANDANAFLASTHVEDNPIEIECEIYDFNKFDDSGKLRVAANQGLPEKDYRFEVIGKQDDRIYIEAMLRQRVKLVCLKEIGTDPISGEKIVGLQVIKRAA